VHLIKDTKERERLASRAASLIDGQGARRVIQKLSAQTI